MSVTESGGDFSYDRFLRSFIGLLLAPVAGSAIAIAGYVLASLARGAMFDSLPPDAGASGLFLVTIGIEDGVRIGIIPTFLVGWPLHLILLRTGYIHLATYITFGAALGATAVQVMLTLVFRDGPYASAVPFEVTLLAACAGGIGATIFWLIRRPDHDLQG